MDNYNRIAVIKHYPKLNKLFLHWRKLARATHNGWPAVFGTDGQKRRVMRRDKMAKRFCDAVRKEFNITRWKVRDLENTGETIVWSE